MGLHQKEENKMINRVVLIGRLTKDPVLRKTLNNKSVAAFTIACDRNTNQNQDADFINCIAWNHVADFLAKYIKKGALVSLEGRIQTRSYDDKNGNRIFKTEVAANLVQPLESKKERQQREQVNSSEAAPEPEAMPISDQELNEIDNSDLPF